MSTLSFTRSSNVYFPQFQINTLKLQFSSRNYLYLTYRFEPSLSAGDPSTTNVTTLNIPLLYVAAAVERQLAPWQAQLVLPWIWNALGETFFISLPVQSLLWGYYEPMVALAIDFVQSLYPNVTLDLDPNIGLFQIVCPLISRGCFAHITLDTSHTDHEQYSYNLQVCVGASA